VRLPGEGDQVSLTPKKFGGEGEQDSVVNERCARTVRSIYVRIPVIAAAQGTDTRHIFLFSIHKSVFASQAVLGFRDILTRIRIRTSD
jgi:hypothetical protein